MAGDRDTEIAIVGHQPQHVGPGRQNGAVFGFRMNLWIEHTGTLVPEWSAPETPACVGRMRELAERNLATYMAPVPTYMSSHICTYPFSVTDSGTITPRFASFPDTDGAAPIVGSESLLLPSMLTA